jgi:hypothetical protein
VVELVFVVGGTILYWRAATETLLNANQSTKRAWMTAAALLAFGVLTLGLNLFGL